MGITSAAHVQVNESDGFVKICVQADRASQTTYEVVFNTVNGEAIGIHYETVSCMITITSPVHII